MFALSDKPNPLSYLIYLVKENLLDTASSLGNTNVNDSSIFNNTIDSMKILNNSVGTVIHIENKETADDSRFSDSADALNFSGNFEVISKFTPQNKFKRKVKIKAVNILNTKVIL